MSSKDNNQTKKEKSGLSTVAKVAIGVGTGLGTFGAGAAGYEIYNKGKEMQQQEIPVNKEQKSMDPFKGHQWNSKNKKFIRNNAIMLILSQNIFKF